MAGIRHVSSSGKEKQYVAIAVGVVVGLVVGYVFMGTAHAIFEIGAETSSAHLIHSHTAPGGRKTIHKGTGYTIHSLVTGNGSPYQNIQLRIMYGTYKMIQKMPGGEKHTGFTRILHRTTDDRLMAEIPTFRATPLHPTCDTWCEFPVADRPNAVMQWIGAAIKDPSMILGDWILLLESDYVWMKPLKAPDARNPAAKGFMYDFDYIHPLYMVPLMQRLAEGINVKTIPKSGPAPVLLRFADLANVAPAWEKFTAQIEADAEAKDKLGWVREMYAWDLAVAQTKIQTDVKGYPDSPLISQPPHDTGLGAASLFHYTWGAIYKEDGKEIYEWDKRKYIAADMEMKLPKIKMPPVWREGVVLQDGLPVTKELNDALVAMLTQMNKAIDQSKDLSKS